MSKNQYHFMIVGGGIAGALSLNRRASFVATEER